MKTCSEKFGKAELRWMPEKGGGFAGTVIRDGKRLDLLRHQDEKQLVAALRNAAGMLEPNYVGFPEAMARFLRFMPDAFAGDERTYRERPYKLRAAEALAEALPLDLAPESGPDDARRVAASRIWTNLLSPYEAMRLKDTLLGQSGARFVHGAALFAKDQLERGAREMELAMAPHGRLSWPLATYFPYLWDYRRHMFLKPEVTKDFSERVGLAFHHEYDSAVDASTYQALLDLVAQTRTAIAALAPADNIDIQSFIWVVGEYRDGDESE